MEHPGYAYEFGICRRGLTISGIWSDVHFTKIKKFATMIVFAINIFIIFVFMNVVQTIQLFIIWGDLDRMSSIISTADFSLFIIVLKMCVFRIYRKELAQLVEYAENDWKENKTPEEAETMKQYAKTTNLISLTCIFTGNLIVHQYIGLRIGQEYGLVLGIAGQRLPLFDAYFPYDATRSPAYEITYVFQYLAALLANTSFTGMYCLFVALVLHLCGQLANLKRGLIRVVKYDEKERTSRKEFYDSLAQIVRRHRSIISCANTIESIYNPMFLAEILSSTIQMVSQWFTLVTLIARTEGSLPYIFIVFMICYTVHSMFHLFACCFAAERLQNESASMFEAAYSCEWYNLSARDAKLLIMIMQKTQMPLKVTAGKLCTFGLELFATIMKSAGGYLSILLAVRDRLVLEET